MKISEKKSSEIYRAIDDRIIHLRLSLQNGTVSKVTDEMLFSLEQMIWRDIAKVLGIQP